MSILNFFHSYLPAPVIVQWGPLSLHWYGALVGLGVLVSYWLVRQQWLREDRKLFELDKLFGWLLLGGLIGARLLDVFLFEWWYFKDHLIKAWYFWDGGLSWHGALLAGLLVLSWRYRRSITDWLSMLDIFAPALAAGQAIGRWGNYFNQELFGLPTSLPWGILIAKPWRPLAYIDQVYFHPVFLYESLALIVLAGCLWRLGRKQFKPGVLFAGYLVATGLIRFALEFIRLDEQLVILGIRSGLWLASIMVIIGGSWLVAITRQSEASI